MIIFPFKVSTNIVYQMWSGYMTFSSGYDDETAALRQWAEMTGLVW